MDDIQYLDNVQIIRLYNAIHTHHHIEKAMYMGNCRFKIETDKRSFIAVLDARMTKFVLEGIKIDRD